MDEPLLRDRRGAGQRQRDAVTPVLKTELLRIYDFGFEIPAAAIIWGIELQARCRHTDATETARIELRLTTGSDKSGHLSLDSGSEVVTRSGTAIEEVSVGNGTELWGQARSPAQINAFTFGLAAKMSIDGVGALATDISRIDVLRVLVLYTLPEDAPVVSRSRDRERGR